MKKNILTILITLLNMAIFSQIQFSGTVVDSHTKAPLQKAIVTLNGIEHTLITNENGYFSLNFSKSGVYDFEIAKKGYESLFEELVLNESIEIQIALTSITQKTNMVFKDKDAQKAEQKEKVKAEKVLARKLKKGETLTLKEKVSLQNQTDFESKVLNELALKKQKELEAKQKQETTFKKEAEASVKNKNTYNSVSANLYTLSGTIKDKENKIPLSKATISFEGMKKTYTTSSDGVFKFKIPEGDYFMYVKMDGFETEFAKIPVASDLDITIFLSKEIENTYTSDEVVISGTRASKNTPTTFTKIKREELLENNLGKDLPYLLELTPSVVASSDGGNGTGYTSMRIRGSDMTRINFTLNGFPMNDAESQGVFLVNVPDLSSDIEDIQIQRGIGTSTNGAGAFGASVNINTNKKHKKAYAEINNSYGSFKTIKNTIKAGTGLINDHFTFDGRFSHLQTDGFIDRARAKMFAYSLNAAYYGAKTVIRFNVFSGKEETYQAWNGVGYYELMNDRTFNSSGTDYGQKEVPYKNEIDKYDQDNYQLSFSQQLSNKISANLGFHYTKGKGYFEQFKISEDLIDYGIISSSINTDLVRRRWLDNDFWGTIFSLNYKAEKLKATLGGAWNQYDGDHYGTIIWANNANDINIDEYYYFSKGLKTDFNTFVKAEFTVAERLILFGDVQYRYVDYSIDGNDNDQKNLFNYSQYNFINPKLGATILLGKEKQSNIYASFAMANREPTRNDFIDNDNVPKPESMMDFELGFRSKAKKINLGINAYYMAYKDQLVLTGELNDVGSAIRANVDNSFRTGLELDLNYQPIKVLGIKATGNWSLSQIANFTATDYLGNTETFSNTKNAYSPQLVSSISIHFKPVKGLEFALINKYVSEQYLDNTTSKKKVLTPYFLNDARISYSLNPKFMKEIKFIFKINNILNAKYSTNGYVYYDTPYFYPQAGTNIEAGLNLKF